MSEQTFSIITIISAGITLLITFIWILVVNGQIAEVPKKWDINKKTFTVILGLLAGLSIGTGFRIAVISAKALITKDTLSQLNCVGNNLLLSQLLSSAVYFFLAGVIFFILGIRGLAVLLKP